MPGDMTHFQLNAFQTIEVVLSDGGGRNTHFRVEKINSIYNFKFCAQPFQGSGWACFHFIFPFFFFFFFLRDI